MANPLNLITKLLAKAESTNSEHERDALLAKAQELQTAYAIEQGMIDQARAARGEAREGFKQIRLCTERNTPLIKAKRELVSWLADVNNCFVVLGYKRAYMEVTGHESDVIMVEHMFASILLQMQRAMAQAEARGEVVGELKGWRTSFAHGYVRRVGLRMNDAKLARTRVPEAAAGSALVLRNRAQLSKEFAEGHYGNTLSKGRRIPRSDNNVFGRGSGDAAGSRADLGGERLGSSTNRKEIGS